MAWLRYYPSTTIPSTPNDQDFRYPYIRRRIPQFIPFDNIEKDTWLFCEARGIEVDEYYDGNFFNDSYTILKDPSSYIVAFDPSPTLSGSVLEDLPIVESVVIDEKIWFKAYENHTAGTAINGTYVLYYRTPNLKTFLNDPIIDPETVNQYTYVVTPTSSLKYGFSFVNSETDWNNGYSKYPGAKVYGTFSGDRFKIIGDKGPNGGSFRIRFTSLSRENSSFQDIEDLESIEEELDHDDDSTIVVDEDNWVTVDTYAPTALLDQVLFEYTYFQNKNYSFELELLQKRNPLSLGNDVILKSYQFSYNPFVEILPEEINTGVHVYGQMKIGR